MAQIERFTAKAPNRPNLEPSTDSGAEAALAHVSGIASRIAADYGRRAKEAALEQQAAALKQQAAAGQAHGAGASMPGLDFAFAGNSASTTPATPAGPAGAGVAAGAKSERTSQAMAFFMSKGWAKHQAGGIVGNLLGESSLDTAARNPGDGADGSDSIGIGQWNSGRARALKAFAAAAGTDWTDFNTQLAFVDHELRTSEISAGNMLRAAGDVRAATEAFIMYERPAGSNKGARFAHNYAGRLANAASAAGLDITQVGVPAAVPASGMTAGSGITVKLTGQMQPLVLKPAGTPGNDAFNEAAVGAYLARADTAMRQQMEGLAIAHEGNPAGLIQALDAARAGFLDGQPPEVRIKLDQSFATQRFALIGEASTRYRQQQESANLAAFEGSVAARTRNAYRLAASDADPADIDAQLAGELAGLEAEIDASTMTPLQKSRAKVDAAEGVMSARVLGGFSALSDPAERAAYAQQFRDDYRAGEGASAALPLSTFEKIDNELTQKLNQDAAAAAKQAAALDKSIDEQIGFLKKGLPVSEATRERLRGEVAKTDNAALAADLDFLDGLAQSQKVLIASPIGTVDTTIARLRKQMTETGTTAAAVTALDTFETLRDSMAKGLAEDPLTWADRAGVAKIEPLDFTDAASLSASLTERTSDAAAIATHYGIEPKFFTPGEADGLKKMLKKEPLAMPSLVSGLAAGLGDDTPRALAEISGEAPILAQVAGLVHATGSQRIAVEVAEALDLRNQPGYKSALPTAGKLQSAAASFLGEALGPDVSGMAEVMDTAGALFERRALARGIAMDEFDVTGSPARELYLQSLDEVLGASMRGGVKYGGVAEVNGSVTVAPPDIAAEAMQDMLSALSADDMALQQPTDSANFVPVSLEQIRAGTLVRVGNGRYRVATGEMATGDPKYVARAGGGYFELDFALLKRSQTARGASTYRPPIGRGGR